MKIISLLIISFCTFFFNRVEAQDTCLVGDCENGIGTLECSCGYTFKGEFKDGEKVYGTMIKEDLTYTGSFENGMVNGKGLMVYQDSSYYQGDFVNAQMDGEGQYYEKNYMLYQGGMKQNRFDGWGVVNYDSVSGDERLWMLGQYEKDIVNGWSALELKDGRIIVGVQKNGLIDGEAFIYENGVWQVFVYKKGKQKTEGQPVVHAKEYTATKSTLDQLVLESENGLKISLNLTDQTFEYVDSEMDVKLSFILTKSV